MTAMGRGLPVGVQIIGRPPVGASMTLAKAMEVAGADSLWVVDHWMWLVPIGLWDRGLFRAARVIKNPEATFDTFAFLGALAGRTRRARLGSAVTEAIRRHPAQIAQAALTVHHLSRGRFILGIGAGERENVEPYGLSYAGQVSRLEEALYAIRLLWAHPNEYVSFAGRYVNLDGAVIGTGPYRRTFPPIWVAAHGRKALRLAGRYGDGWLPTHQMEPDEYADHLAEVRRAAREAGRPVDRFTPSYEARMLFAASHNDAHRLLDSNALRLGALAIPASVWKRAGADHPFGGAFRGIADYVPSRLDPDEVRDHMSRVPFEVLHTAFDHGTPEQLVSRALSYRAVGLRHMVVQNVTPLVEPMKAVSSFRALASLIRILRRS
jgi:phthiodiolone/phenolphthiodiolone dimycocerosates ketoreductase